MQSKRTNVGIALVSSPRVLFLDEPTSGLDSYTSSEVMEVVQVKTYAQMKFRLTAYKLCRWAHLDIDAYIMLC